MASYAYRSVDERQKIQSMWEHGTPAKDMASTLGVSLSSLYSELRRGFDGTRLPNMRRRYDAQVAQLRMQQSLERRGRKPGA